MLTSRETWPSPLRLSKLTSTFVLIAHLGTANDNTVFAVFETDNPDKFVRLFNDAATGEAMSEDKITGGVETFLPDEVFTM